MNKKIAIIGLLILAVIISGIFLIPNLLQRMDAPPSGSATFSSGTTAAPPQPSTTQFSARPISFTFTTVQAATYPTYEDYGVDYPIAITVNTKEGIVNHLSRLGYPDYLDILEQLEQYDDAFFADHSLIFVWNRPDSSAASYEVKSVTQIAEDELEITLQRTAPEAVTYDMVSGLTVIAVAEKTPEKTVVNVRYTNA